MSNNNNNNKDTATRGIIENKQQKRGVRESVRERLLQAAATKATT